MNFACYEISLLNADDIRVGGASMPTGMIISAFSRQDFFTLRAEADQLGQEGVETFPVPLLITSQGLTVPVFAADPAMITVNDRSGERSLSIYCVQVITACLLLF